MRNRLNEARGFTVVEMMVAVVILLTGALGTLAMLDTANQRTRTADDRQKAVSLAREILETAKGVPYRQVTQATLVERLREDQSIAGSSASPWRVEREGTPYTVRAEVCWLDEPADGLGSRSAGGFCDGSGNGGASDTNPIDFKRVTVNVAWNNGSGGGSVTQSTLITVRGGADAPAVQSVRLTSPLTSPITDPAVPTASFAVTTAANAPAVVWSIDGSQQGTAAGSGRNWTFSWALPPDDGTYDVAAQSLEASGLVGEPRSVTVVLNRFLPRAPENFRAGRNKALVETAWAASPERDVVGYRVYRQGSGGQQSVVCSFTTDTTCIDASAPAATAGLLDYWVVAIEEAGDVRREGEPSARVDVNGVNRPPHAPQALILTKDAQGNTVLRWDAPPVPDPDVGDGIALYRVYRDGTAIENRHLTAGASELTATDTRMDGNRHSYWVTAVDNHLAESPALGPVTG